MRVDRRLVLIGVMVVVLSMTMATQYATTQIAYSFSIVHPSNADIRFIGSDNSSDDGIRVLRVDTNTSTNQYLTVELGDWAPGQTKNYTAAFGIVNEENFSVDITHVNISGGITIMDIWLHHDRSADYTGETADQQVMVVNNGAAQYTSTSTAWTLGAGDGVTSTMCADGDTTINTPWDSEVYDSHVRYSMNDDNNSVNGSSDFVWVGISLTVPTNEALADNSGNIYIHFRSTTDT